MTKRKLVLVSYELCPYVQRSIIILNEKNITHSREYINLSNPPAWFSKKSPLEKVPLLIVDDKHVLFESAVICEYLDEITPNTMLPAESMKKAIHRAWIEFGSQILNDIGALYSSQNKSNFNKKLIILKQKMNRLENEIILPYFSGSDFMMIDAVYATIFRYFDTLDTYLAVDMFENCNKLIKWRNILRKNKSVINAVKSDYPEKLLEFFLNQKSYFSTKIEQQTLSSTS